MEVQNHLDFWPKTNAFSKNFFSFFEMPTSNYNSICNQYKNHLNLSENDLIMINILSVPKSD